MNSANARLPDHLPAAQYLALLASGAFGKGATVRVRPRSSREEDLHRACFEWVELVQPQHAILRMGTKPGVPDFLLPRRHRQWAGLAIELKSDAGRISVNKKAWLDAFAQDGYLTAVCRTPDEFMVAVMRYLQADPITPAPAPATQPASAMRTPEPPCPKF